MSGTEEIMSGETGGTDTVSVDAGRLTAVLRNMMLIVDTCARRGAFEGSELASVGGFRDTVTAMLDEFGGGDGE